MYEVCKGFLPTVSPFLANTPLLVYLLSGAAGEAIGSVVRAPSEAVKVRLQSGLADSPAEAFMQVRAATTTTLLRCCYRGYCCSCRGLLLTPRYELLPTHFAPSSSCSS